MSMSGPVQMCGTQACNAICIHDTWGVTISGPTHLAFIYLSISSLQAL